MKKLISLAVALAMVLSVVPMFSVAFAEETVVEAERMLYFNNASDIGTANGNEGGNVSVLIAGGGSWSSASSFTDEDGTVTNTASLEGTNFGSPRNAFVAFTLPDIDYDKLVNATLSMTVKGVKQTSANARIGVYGNSLTEKWTADAAGKTALGTNGVGGFEFLGLTDAITVGKWDGYVDSNQTVNLSSKKLVSYLKQLKDDGYTEVTFRLAGTMGGIWVYNADQPQKPTLTLETGDAVDVTVKTVLS
ncbi:MAG: hypothetical protein ACI4SS_01430, partial [Clostridia bacterium]